MQREFLAEALPEAYRDLQSIGRGRGRGGPGAGIDSRLRDEVRRRQGR